MTPAYADDLVTVHHSDCLDVLRAMPDCSVDAIVTDPPYGLGFMGKEWDSGKSFVERRPARRNAFDHVGGNHNPVDSADRQRTLLRENRALGQWCERWAAECLRVLKPGGHLLAFGGTRTVHRLTCGIEDAGFEVRDGIDWLYASGMPKSFNVSKAIDKAAGAQRQVVGYDASRARPNRLYRSGAIGNVGGHEAVSDRTDNGATITAPATEDAVRWEGWGTALKPAREPIVVARKPLSDTVAANVLEWGTGVINIDACRVDVADVAYTANCSGDRGHAENRTRRSDFRNTAGNASPAGRWPPNVVLSHAETCGEACVPGCPVAELDRQSGHARDGVAVRRNGVQQSELYGEGFGACEPGSADLGYGGQGGASRFFPVFRFEAKAPSSERPRGEDGTAHPTVKPLDLMRWLVRLVTPPGGLVVDPFAGSGTTAEACTLEGFRCVAIEREPCGGCAGGCPDYLSLIKARLGKPLQPSLDIWGDG